MCYTRILSESDGSGLNRSVLLSIDLIRTQSQQVGIRLDIVLRLFAVRAGLQSCDRMCLFVEFKGQSILDDEDARAIAEVGDGLPLLTNLFRFSLSVCVMASNRVAAAPTFFHHQANEQVIRFMEEKLEQARVGLRTALTCLFRWNVGVVDSEEPNWGGMALLVSRPKWSG